MAWHSLVLVALGLVIVGGVVWLSPWDRFAKEFQDAMDDGRGPPESPA
jgi:hypothetical protein